MFYYRQLFVILFSIIKPLRFLSNDTQKLICAKKMTLFGVIHTFRTPIVSLKDRTFVKKYIDFREKVKPFGETIILRNCSNFGAYRQ